MTAACWKSCKLCIQHVVVMLRAGTQKAIRRQGSSTVFSHLQRLLTSESPIRCLAKERAWWRLWVGVGVRGGLKMMALGVHGCADRAYWETSQLQIWFQNFQCLSSKEISRIADRAWRQFPCHTSIGRSHAVASVHKKMALRLWEPSRSLFPGCLNRRCGIG